MKVLLLLSLALFGTLALPTKEGRETAVIYEDGSNPVVISFVGDIMLDRYIRQRGEESGYDHVVGDTRTLFTESDLVVGNLEGPVTASSSRSVGTLPPDLNNFTFTFAPESLRVLKLLGVGIVSLANNHTLNFGYDGLRETRTHLKKNNVRYFGAPDEKGTLTTITGNTKIVFVPYNEFASREASSTVEIIKSIERARSATIIVVFAHWGEEYETMPRENDRELAHAFVDAGADLVVGAHPHVIQPKEIYNDRLIYYSLGNFIFDQYWNDGMRCGAVVTIEISEDMIPRLIRENFVWLEEDGSTIMSDCKTEIPYL